MSRPCPRRPSRRGHAFPALWWCGLCLPLSAVQVAADSTRPDYPATNRAPVTEELHGVKLVDPYRWLEDDDSSEVAAWVRAQVEFAGNYFERIPRRDTMRQELERLIRVPTFGVIRAYQTRYFSTRRDPEQNHAVIYQREGKSDATPWKVLDPNTFSADGTVALDWWYPSPDGALIAYGKSAGGSENSTLYVLDVRSGRTIAESIPGTKFCSLAWMPDNSGFHYTRYPQPGDVPAGDENYFNHLYFHKLGTDWKSDPKVWGAGEPKEKRASVGLSSNRRWLFKSTTLDWAKNDLFVRPAADLKAPFRPVAVGLEAKTGGDSLGDRLLLLTNHEAPRYRVVEADPANPDPARWKDVIPQQPGVIQSMELIGGRIVLTILENVCSRIVIHDSDGRKEHEVELPGPGAAGGVNGNHDGNEFFFAFESFAHPPTTYRCDVKTGRIRQVDRSPVEIDPARYEARQLWYTSKDGTRVPMFVVHRRGLKKDGNNPTLLYGYGGFNISMAPRFRNDLFVWLDRGGVYAVANIRGGGEFGAEWHQAGRRDRKQNCFDDFIAAAKFLCDEKYTRPQRLAALGGSNGGLLMGAMMTQAPEQFRAIVCAVPLLDMIRYHRFSMARFWIQEYGSAEDPAEFRTLLAYSPYQNVRKGTKYPAVLIETGDSDGRVAPCHARKMAALLQAETGSDRPILLRYETKAGHGAGKPVSKQIENRLDEWSFLIRELGVN